MEPIDTYEHKGIEIRVYHDDHPESGNPREGDQLTTLVCWHPDYVLGDEQIRGDRGAVETVFESERGNTTIVSMRHLHRYLTLMRKAIHVRPLYLLDHSGISISAGAPSPFDNPTVRSDEFGQGMGWDTSMVGFVYTTHERITELCGDGEKYHSDEWIAEQVANDVRYYDEYQIGRAHV